MSRLDQQSTSLPSIILNSPQMAKFPWEMLIQSMVEMYGPCTVGEQFVEGCDGQLKSCGSIPATNTYLFS